MKKIRIVFMGTPDFSVPILEGLIKEYEMEYLLKKHFKNCETKRTSYNHSTQGKGNINLEELLFIAYN